MNRLIIFLFIFSIKISSSKRICPYDILENQKIVITDLDQLDCTYPFEVSMLEIKPKVKRILNDSIDFSELSLSTPENHFQITVINFNGFVLNSNPFDKLKINTSNQIVVWDISLCDFNVYYSNIHAEYDCNNNCNERILKANYSRNIFTSANFLIFSNSASNRICPFIFNNVRISLLSILKVSNSFIEKKYFNFQATPKNISASLNSFIYQFQAYFYHVQLDGTLLNKYVFKNLLIIDIDGVLSGIDNDVFKSLKKLKLIRIRNQNVRRIFALNNKWLDGLNPDLRVDFHNQSEYEKNFHKSIVLVIFQSAVNLTFYNYPNEDFCYFKNFPHNRLVLIKLKPNIPTSRCSCTELFLIQYSAYYSKYIDYYIQGASTNYYFLEYYADLIYQKSYSRCYTNSIQYYYFLNQCNFELMAQKCNVGSLEKDQFYFYIYDWLQLSTEMRFVLIWVISMFALFGVLINFLMILILSSDNTNDKMYFHLKLNTLFNLAYCIILFSRLAKNNYNYDKYIYERAVYTSVFFQYYNIIVIKFLGSLVKSAANITYVSFAISRYSSILNTKNRFLLKFNKISRKVYISMLLIICAAINIYICFEYTIIDLESNKIANVINIENFTSYYRDELIEDYKENFSESEFIILTVSQYIKIIFSDLVYIIISTLIDFMLFYYVKQRMNLKKNLLSINTIAVAIINPNKNDKIRLKKNKPMTTKDRISRMVILNGINFLIFRLPSALISFYGFIYRYDKHNKKHRPDFFSYVICKRFRFCEGLSELFLLAYLISFLFQFLIFYFLDKNFKLNINKMKKKFKRKIS